MRDHQTRAAEQSRLRRVINDDWITWQVLRDGSPFASQREHELRIRSCARLEDNPEGVLQPILQRAERGIDERTAVKPTPRKIRIVPASQLCPRASVVKIVRQMPSWKIEEGRRLRDLDETLWRLVPMIVSHARKLVVAAKRHKLQHQWPPCGHKHELANQIPQTKEERGAIGPGKDERRNPGLGLPEQRTAGHRQRQPNGFAHALGTNANLVHYQPIKALSFCDLRQIAENSARKTPKPMYGESTRLPSNQLGHLRRGSIPFSAGKLDGG